MIYDFSLFPPPIQGPVLLCLWRDLCQMLVSKTLLRWTRLENKRIFLWIKKRFPENWANCKRESSILVVFWEYSWKCTGDCAKAQRLGQAPGILLWHWCGRDLLDWDKDIRVDGDWWQEPLETWSLSYILGRLREETPRSTEAVRSWRQNPADILKIMRCQCWHHTPAFLT